MKAQITFVNDEGEEGGQFEISDANGNATALNAENGVVFVEIPENHMLALISTKTE